MSVKPALAPKIPPKFDLQKLEAMVEPFNVRVEKIRGSARYEIPLPLSDNGGPPGTGWSKDQVREVGTFLVNEWSGGGHYLIGIVDSSPTPQVMEWTLYYPPSEFPETIPPTLRGAAAIPQQPVVPAPTPLQAPVRSMAQFQGGNALPLASYFQQPGAASPLPQQGYFPPPAPMPYGYPYAAQPPTNEVRALQEQLAAAREAAAQREFERRLAEIKAESDRRYAETQTMMQQMVDRMTQQLAARAPVVDPQANELREQNRLLQEQVRHAQETALRERREQELQAQVRAHQEEVKRLIDESNRRFEAFSREASADKTNPQFLMFQSMFQSQMEAMKEIARNSQSQIDRLQHFMMRPQDVLSIAKESAAGSDHVSMQMNRAWEQMFAVSRQLTEQAAQLNQGGGNEIVGLIRDAGTKVGEWAERYTGGKTKEAVASMNAQAEIAKAQADVLKSQQERMAEMARIEAALKTGTVVQMPDGVYRGGPGAQQGAMPAAGETVSSNGHSTVVIPPTPPWIPPKTPRTSQPVGSGLGGPVVAAPAPAPAPQPQPAQPVQQQIMTGDSRERRVKGRTDAEWFGVILPNVALLRAEVDKFMDGLRKTPPEKHGLAPEETAFAIFQAANEIHAKQIPVAAVIELLIQGMVADFLDVLLPDAPQPYRDDVVKILMNAGAPPEDESGEDDDDDDDDDDDEGTDQPVA